MPDREYLEQYATFEVKMSWGLGRVYFIKIV